MINYWRNWWSDIFENSFNYTYRIFNPDIRIGTDDDIVIMGDVTVVLPFNKRLEDGQRNQIKDTIIEALKAKYRDNKAMFRIESKSQRLIGR